MLIKKYLFPQSVLAFCPRIYSLESEISGPAQLRCSKAEENCHSIREVYGIIKIIAATEICCLFSQIKLN